MKSAIYLPIQGASDELQKKKPYKILQFGDVFVEEQESLSDHELRLQSEVRALRETLREVQRQVEHYESLLRNAHLRERELRAELLKRR